MRNRTEPTRLEPHVSARRSFLVGTCAAAGMLALGCGSSPKSQGARPAGAGTQRQLGVALLGLGSYSESQLAKALRTTRHCALRGIVTGTPSKIEPWQKAHAIKDGNVYDYQTLPRIADNPDIDVVYVVVPTSLHAKYTIMAAEAGKHVFCEKPMAMTVAECQQMIDACRRNGVSLSIGYRMQHEPNTQTVMRYARDKPYGAIRSVRAMVGDRSGGEPSWRMQKAMGGGAAYDVGVYSINALRYASGEEPVRVIRARQWAERPELFREVDEITEFELEMRSGLVCYGSASRFQSQNQLRIEAERGWYELQPMQSYQGVQGATSDGKKLDKPGDGQQARQMDDDALAILERRPQQVPGEEGLRDIRIVEAIIESAQRGASVVI